MSSSRIIVRDSGFRGPKGDKGDPGPGGGSAGPGVAAGGTTGQLLKKNSGTDYDTGWMANPVPTGGSIGQVLKKTSGTDFATAWQNESGGSGVPVGGTINQGLFKNSSTDGDASWKDAGVVIHGLTGKTTPIDADELGMSDSAASNVWKKLTFANLKAWIKAQISIDQLVIAAANVNLNSHKLTNVTDPTSAQDAATKTYVDGIAGAKLDASLSAIAASAVGLTIMVVYDDTLGWVLPSGYSTNANIGWCFNGGDDAHAPPATTSVRREWNKPAS